MTFGEKLSELRKAKLKDDKSRGWSQDDLAVASGIPAGTVRGHEQGRREPTLGHLYAYCKALGVSCEIFKDCTFRTAPKKRGGKKADKST